MSPDQVDLLAEAKRSLEAAELLVNQGFPGYAASRAYYAMFYAAEAFLEGDGLSFSKHSAVIAAFGREYAATGRVPQEFHRFLLEAQELRHKGDYPTTEAVTTEGAREQVERARQFLEVARRELSSS